MAALRNLPPWLRTLGEGVPVQDDDPTEPLGQDPGGTQAGHARPHDHGGLADLLASRPVGPSARVARMPAADRRAGRAKVGPGGGGTAARAASVVARRRRSSRQRLSSPRAIAQRWLAAKTGLNAQLNRRSKGLVAVTRQS